MALFHSLLSTLVVAVCLQPGTLGWWDESHTCVPVHCAWGDWSEWGPCPAGCGKEGNMKRTRIQKMQAWCGGAACTGPHIQLKPCRGDCGPTDKMCQDVGGKCDHEVFGCTAMLVNGFCPTKPKYVKCCIPRSACTVAEYKNTNMVGNAAYVEKDFRPWMDKINAAATKCGVQVAVNRSFILAKTAADEFSKPSCQSGLPTGHGITFTLQSGVKSCDAKCLIERYNDESLCEEDPFKCFILAAQDTGLRWGGSWNGHLEGGHLDDNFFFRNPCRHSVYWTRLQAACRHLPVPTLEKGQ